MALSLLALLLLEAFNPVQGAIYKPSKQTSPAENTPNEVNGWTPKPTAPPRFPPFQGQVGRIQNHQYGAMKAHDLFARADSSGTTSSVAQDLATCGWYNGDGSEPLYCTTSEACAYLTTPAPQWFACCPTDDSGNVDWSQCPYYDKCYPFDSYSAPNTWTGSEAYAPSGTSFFYCPSAYPYCNTIFLDDTVSSTYQHIYCDTTSSTWEVLQSTTPTSSSASESAQGSTSSSQQGQSIPAAPTTVTVTKSRAAGNSLTLSHSSTTSTPTGGSGNSKTNVGAIAGGVVGGVAGVALLGAAVGYLVYRKRKAHVEPMREVSIYSQNYSNSNNAGYSHQGGYNQNY